MPLLGKAVRHEWALDWEFLSVNRGPLGATPRIVLAAQREWRQRMDTQPGRFMRWVLPEALRHAAGRLDALVDADGKHIAFVENATTGCNALLRPQRLARAAGTDDACVLCEDHVATPRTGSF